jgi:hypothetical protein
MRTNNATYAERMIAMMIAWAVVIIKTCDFVSGSDSSITLSAVDKPGAFNECQ